MNTVVIGHNASGRGSNTTVLGNSSTTDSTIFGCWTMTEQAEPSDPAEGEAVLWLSSDGTSTGDAEWGDLMVKITKGGQTKTATLANFAAL